jgi:uncharacterized membrane protein YoaK (UPF0700 family)
MTKPAGFDRAVILVEVRGLVLAGWLAALAGIVDAIGYLHLGGLFVSYMSGNSTQLAVASGKAAVSKPAPSPS